MGRLGVGKGDKPTDLKLVEVEVELLYHEGM